MTQEEHNRQMRMLDWAFAAVVFSLGLWLGFTIANDLVNRHWHNAALENRIAVMTNETKLAVIIKKN